MGRDLDEDRLFFAAALAAGGAGQDAARARTAASSASAATTIYEGRIADRRVERFRYDDGEEVEREIVAHPGAVGDVALDDEQVWLVRQPREAVGEPDLLELPAGKLDEEGEEPLEAARRELAEEIGKAAATWEHLTSFYSPASPTRRMHVFLATGLRDATPAEAEEDERIEIVRWPLADLDDADRRLPRRQDARRLLWLRARGVRCRREQPRCTRKGRRWRGRTRAGTWPSPAPIRAAQPSSTWCSTSSPTSSSSAGCRATRSRPTAPTCSSSAPSSRARAARARAPGHPTWPASSTELRGAATDRPPVAPATLQRKAACLRSFYRHLRREELIDHDPTADLRAPRKRQRLPQVLSRAEVAKLLAAAARGPTRRRCATARCSS